MKKVFTLILAVSLSLFVTNQLEAQTPRMAMVELATQASCPPCASNNPITLGVVNANSETTIMMAYQVWWPGYDPMYLDNPGEVIDRIQYYGINGAPSIVVQGSEEGLNLTQGNVDNATATMSEFAMNLNTEVVDGSIHVTGTVEASMVASGDFRLRIALSEDLITIGDAPGGTNGETEYHHVFKRFVGGSEGLDLPNDWAVGDMYDVDVTLPTGIVNIYHLDGMEIIAWIQNDTDKYIHQAAKVTGLEVIANHATNGVAVETSGVAATFCTGANTISPVVKIQNVGSDNLTSADLVYSLNGGDSQTFAWTGDLGALESANVTLDPISFDHLADGSTLDVMLTNPNGTADGDDTNNSVDRSLATAPLYENTIELTLITDNYGNETYWQLSNDAGDVIASGGNAGVGLNNTGVGAGSPPADAGSYGNNQTITEEIAIPADGCYTFTITDYWGDGICCSFGAGSYELADADGQVLLSGGAFGAQEDLPFEGTMLVNTQDVEFTSKFSVSPNPVLDYAQLEFTLETADVTTVSVVNSLGQVVSQENLGKLSAGLHNISVDMSDYSAGVYLININSGNISGTKKVIK